MAITIDDLKVGETYLSHIDLDLKRIVKYISDDWVIYTTNKQNGESCAPVDEFFKGL